MLTRQDDHSALIGHHFDQSLPGIRLSRGS